jgi:nicotinamide-nucleotide amidase
MNTEINQLSTQLGEALLSKKAIVTTAESCTGGGVAQAITDIAGSSQWFHCGYITYANHAKYDTLGVSAELLAAQGAVCESVVIEMARGAAHKAKADYAIAISGVAGPTGGSSNKPVGTVWFACLGPQGIRAVKHQLGGDRKAVREQSVKISLQQLLHQVTE